jgi:hypothetical protein
MIVPFDKLPSTSRVWIYQADKTINKNQQQILSVALNSFLEQWTAHGNSLKAGFNLPHDHFLVIGLDESQSGASGCSIDSLFRVMQKAGADVGINFLNRELTAFKVNDQVELVPRHQLKDKLREFGAEVLVFNNLVTTKEELDNQWLLPAASTWLKRYIELSEAKG